MHVTALWLPILVTSAAVFVASAAVWMLMPHHKSDLSGVKDEEGFMDAVRKCAGVAPGYYYFPFAKWSEAGNEEYVAKLRAGPVGILRGRAPKVAASMPRARAKTFVLYLAVNVLIAFLAGAVMPAGAEFHAVFHVTALSAFLAYGLVGVQDSIWFGLPASVAVKHAIDGLVYALITGAIFGWLWPAG